MKQCAGPCRCILPATPEHFHRNKNHKDGLQTLCKTCTKEYKKQHYKTHKEEISEQHRAYRESHLEQERERSKRYAETHKEHLREYHTQYYQDNRDQMLEQMKQHYQENSVRIRERVKRYRETHQEEIKERKKRYAKFHKEHIREYREKHRERILAGQKARYHARYKEKQRETTKRYRTLHRERLLEHKRQYYKTPHGRMIDRAHWHKRRAQKKASGGSYTPAQIQDQLKRQKSKCYWCQSKLDQGKGAFHIDHVVPLSRGGSNDISNIVIACPTCNMSRNNKLPHEWVDGGRLL